MVHNFGRGARRTASEPCLRSACVERLEPTRGSLVEWVWAFLEGYPQVGIFRPIRPREGSTSKGASIPSVLITGVSTGIGAVDADRFARRGLRANTL
jgi:hypothetical protein